MLLTLQLQAWNICEAHLVHFWKVCLIKCTLVLCCVQVIFKPIIRSWTDLTPFALHRDRSLWFNLFLPMNDSQIIIKVLLIHYFDHLSILLSVIFFVFSLGLNGESPGAPSILNVGHSFSSFVSGAWFGISSLIAGWDNLMTDWISLTSGTLGTNKKTPHPPQIQPW